MKTEAYSYYIVRFCPNPGNDEFVNIGLLLLYPNGSVRVKFASDLKRVGAAFAIKTKPLMAQLKQLSALINTEGHSLFLGVNSDSHHEVWKKYIPYPDNALQLSDLRQTILPDAVNPEEAIYQKFIGMFEERKPTRTPNAKEKVWKLYAKPFKLFKVELKPASVQGVLERLHFERTFKNGALHCYEPLPIQDSDASLDALYKLLGKIDSLIKTPDEIKFYFLTELNEGNVNFINAVKELIAENSKRNGIQMQLFNQEQAFELAKQASQLLHHN